MEKKNSFFRIQRGNPYQKNHDYLIILILLYLYLRGFEISKTQLFRWTFSGWNSYVFWKNLESNSLFFLNICQIFGLFECFSPTFFGSLDIKCEKEWKIRYKTWISFGDFFRHFRGSISLFYEFLVKIIGKWVSLVEKTKWKRFIF